jgi:hypothetical protein
MGRETSPYEGTLDTLNGKFCLGRVYSVDAASGTARIRTLGNRRDSTDDRDLTNAKLLCLSWHGEGDYGIVIPRIGAYVIVGFLNSEAIILGSYPLSNTEGGGGRDNHEALLAGDFCYTSVSGSKLIIRAAGTVEVESTAGCRTWYLPTEDTISTLCQNYELDTAGGYAYWNVDKDSGATVFQMKAYESSTPTHAVDIQYGGTDTGAMISLQVGAVDENLDIPTPALDIQVQSDGSTTVNVGPGKVTITIGASGTLSIMTESNALFDVGGDASFSVSGDATIDATGNCNIAAGGNAVIKGNQIQLNGASSGITTANSHLNVIDLITGTPVQPSTTVFGDI